MSISHEHVGPKVSAKIKIYILTRAELLFSLCYEIPCINEIKLTVSSNLDMIFSKLQEFCKNKHCQYKNKTRMDSNGYWIPIIFFSLTFAFWLIVVLIIYFDTHAFDSSRDSCYRSAPVFTAHSLPPPFLRYPHPTLLPHGLLHRFLSQDL